MNDENEAELANWCLWFSDILGVNVVHNVGLSTPNDSRFLTAASATGNELPLALSLKSRLSFRCTLKSSPIETWKKTVTITIV